MQERLVDLIRHDATACEVLRRNQGTGCKMKLKTAKAPLRHAKCSSTSVRSAKLRQSISQRHPRPQEHRQAAGGLSRATGSLRHRFRRAPATCSHQARTSNIIVLDRVYSNTGGQASKRNSYRHQTVQVSPLQESASTRKTNRPYRFDLRLRLRRTDCHECRQRSDSRPSAKLKAYDGLFTHHRLLPLYQPRYPHSSMGHAQEEQQKLPLNVATGASGATTPALEEEGKNPFTLDSRKNRSGISSKTSSRVRCRLRFRNEAVSR